MHTGTGRRGEGEGGGREGGGRGEGGGREGGGRGEGGGREGGCIIQYCSAVSWGFHTYPVLFVRISDLGEGYESRYVLLLTPQHFMISDTQILKCINIRLKQLF